MLMCTDDRWCNISASVDTFDVIAGAGTNNLNHTRWIILGNFIGLTLEEFRCRL